VLISKNSGGAATEAKLAVARERGLPVIMLQRPGLPPAEREFSDTSLLLNALEAWLHPHPLFDKTP
jgi:precorrin-6A/cobalt-precorrin-6A reductase